LFQDRLKRRTAADLAPREAESGRKPRITILGTPVELDEETSGPPFGRPTLSVLKEMGPSEPKEAKMFEIMRKTIEWGGKTLVLETGRIARQADGAVLATMGETVVLATAVFAKKAKPGQDFFPLTVNYHREDLRRGQDPRRLLQARRPSVGKGNPGFPSDRPSDPPPVRQGLQERSPGRRDRPAA
jgi:hypothetical protein